MKIERRGKGAAAVFFCQRADKIVVIGVSGGADRNGAHKRGGAVSLGNGFLAVPFQVVIMSKLAFPSVSPVFKLAVYTRNTLGRNVRVLPASVATYLSGLSSMAPVTNKAKSVAFKTAPCTGAEASSKDAS